MERAHPRCLSKVCQAYISGDQPTLQGSKARSSCLTIPGKAEVARPRQPDCRALAASKTLLPGNLQSSHVRPLSIQDASGTWELLTAACCPLAMRAQPWLPPSRPWATQLPKSPETRATIAKECPLKPHVAVDTHSELRWRGLVIGVAQGSASSLPQAGGALAQMGVL